MNSDTPSSEKEESKIGMEPTFTDREFGSKDGMLTTVWGPGIWHFLHTISFNYPKAPSMKDKNHYRDFVLQLRHVLPCGKCRENLVKNFKLLPLRMSDLENRDTFSRYVYELHELVNRMLNKTSGLTYERVRERYEHFRARCALGSGSRKSLKTAKKREGGFEKRGVGRRGTEKRGVGKKKKKELGCTEPLYKGEKAKCVLKIVPQSQKCDTLQIDSKCLKKKSPMETPVR